MAGQNDILRRSLALAKLTLAVSLAELAHESRNGMLRERVVKFTELAVAANDLLSTPVGEPKKVAACVQEGRACSGKKCPTVPAIPKTRTKTLSKSLEAATREPMWSRFVKLLATKKGAWFSSKDIAKNLGCPRAHVGKFALDARGNKVKVEGEHGKGYRLV